MWLEGQGAEVTGGQWADLGLVHRCGPTHISIRVHLTGSTLHLNKQKMVIVWMEDAFPRPRTGL